MSAHSVSVSLPRTYRRRQLFEAIVESRKRYLNADPTRSAAKRDYDALKDAAKEFIPFGASMLHVDESAQSWEIRHQRQSVPGPHTDTTIAVFRHGTS